MEEFTEREKYIWLAGVIDAECSLGFYKHLSPSGRRGYGWSMRLSTASVTPELLFRIRDFVGEGNIHVRKWSPKPEWKTVFCWELHNKGVRRLMPRILPFLVIKRQQAALLIEVGNLLDGHTTHSTPHDERLLEIWNEMKYLNKRGRAGLNETTKVESEKGSSKPYIFEEGEGEKKHEEFE